MKRKVIIVMLAITSLLVVGCESFENEENMAEEDIVRFAEIDLSEPYWAGAMWMDMGRTSAWEVDLSQFANQKIDSLEFAEYIANEILLQRQANGSLRDFVLRQIDYDPLQSIWIFRYAQYPPVAGMSFYAAISGRNSALLRMWVL